MECTQRLECTQELYRQHENSPEQIGFLGICGTKYPVKRGPNKVGRDPQTCNIVLNLSSISRQHAVINILNQKEFMVMDLDSANKTKLLDKTLQPYMPHPLKNGDTVQFGDVFGVFRLLEDDDDLPMTQAIDIPETPLPTRHVSKFNHAPITMIPESPDVSDKDDSFIIPSQPKTDRTLKNSNYQHFIKPSSKIISIQPVGSKKIDNIFWNSSKKSKSISLHSNDSFKSPSNLIKSKNVSNQNDDDIHDMETQAPYPNSHENNESIYTAETQTSGESQPSPSIHNLDTQLPVPTTEHLPDVREVHGQNEMRLNLYTANEQNDNNIFNAETQIFMNCKEQNVIIKDKIPSTSSIQFHPIQSNSATPKSKTNTSDEEILFDEIDSQPIQDNFESQFLLPQDNILPSKSKGTPSKAQKENNFDDEVSIIKPKKRVVRITSSSSTDCDDIDILPTQKIPQQKLDDDSTDCEEYLNDVSKSQELLDPHIKNDAQVNLEAMPTQLTHVDEKAVKQTDVCFEDMLTQVIDVDINKRETIINNNIDEPDFEDLPTQVIDEVIPNNTERIEYDTQQYSEEIVTPFKVPLQSMIKLKRKDTSIPPIKSAPTESVKAKVDDIHFYESTQDVFNDLCSQKKYSPNMGNTNNKVLNKASSDHSVKIDERLSQIENKQPRKFLNSDRSCSSSEGEDKIVSFVSSLSKQQVREVIGVDSVIKLKKTLSDSSDLDTTPKKVRPQNFMCIDLPNSQEIKTSVCPSLKPLFTESSSDSETDHFEEPNTPILFHKKKNSKADAKIDLTKKFDVETLPTRVMTRVRKPTTKIQESETSIKKTVNNILKPQFLAEQEDGVNNEIICENITRLKNEKSQHNKDFKNNKKNDIIKKGSEIPQSHEHFQNNKKTTMNKEMDSTLDPVNYTSPNLAAENKDINNSMKPHKRQNKSFEPSDNPFETRNISQKNQNIDSSIDSKPSNRSTRSTRNKIKIIEAIPIPPKREKEKKETKRKKPEQSNSKRNNVSKENLDSTIEAKRNSRSSYKTKNTNQNKNKSASPEHDSQKEQSKKKRTQKNRDKESIDKELEVRRSKRQKATKEKKDNGSTSKLVHKSILKKSNPEVSAVYNLSGSNIESPRNLKRPAVENCVVPNPKRTRSALSSTCCSSRSTPAISVKTQHVLFTAFPYEKVKGKLEELGAVVVTDIMQCTVVLTQQIKRTFKLLCAVGLGKPIVGPEWVQACSDNNMIVDPWLHIMKDAQAEKRFQFSLERTLASKRAFLKGYNVSSTPGVMPTASEMKLIVECSGGTWKEEGPQWVCVSCLADRALWSSLRRRGATVVTTEFILGGVLRQKLDIKGNEFK